ncbi:hypothetical protein C2S51_037656 [Perilla frutescens var. frutescens]|nr:hypothetical protein C2S51_037656 [Perilla frutescens var. frutescens]
MAEATQSVDFKNFGRKRNPGKKKGKMARKRQRTMPQGGERKGKIDLKMRKMFQKRARDYNSDEEDEDDDEPAEQDAVAIEVDGRRKNNEKFEVGSSDDGEEENEAMEGEEGEVSEDENGGILPGIVRFSEGIKAFKLAFKKIVKKSGGDDDVLGPVLSAHKKLLGEKLAEEEEDKKVKGEIKKEKHLISEKGHVKPENFLDAHEKFLLGVATKGVVKLFNAVNKAQNAQKGFNPSRTKDEKAIKQRRKEAFFSELGKTSTQSVGTAIKVGTSSGSVDGEAPAWAPLRDNYMLTNPKLKDWDKMQDTKAADDFGRTSDADSSSDDE